MASRGKEITLERGVARWKHDLEKEGNRGF